MKRCFIFAAGTFYGLRERPAPGDVVIAADAGYRVCRKLDIVPDLLLGDFDSMEQPADFVNVRRSPVEKDDTDTMLAIKVALEKGFQDLLLLGMTGGRLDHSIANIQSLVYAVIHGAKACLLDEDLWISAITGGQQITVPYREGFVLSVFAHSDRCSGVCLRDLFYPLENGVITNTFPLGVSNHFLPGKGGKIAIEEGIAVIICNREL